MHIFALMSRFLCYLRVRNNGLGWVKQSFPGHLEILTHRVMFASLCLIALSILAPHFTFAGLGPENCLLVINTDSESSKRIGNEYIQLRSIPSRNVIHLSGVPATDRINQTQFVDKILKPILDELDKRQLDKQINCIIYSTGFPTSVNFSAWMKDLDRKPTKIETPIGSITSLTYLFRHCLVGSPGIVGLESNAYARRSVQVVLNLPFVSRDSMDRFIAAKKLYDEKAWDDAHREFGELLKEQPYQYGLAYWQCRCLAQADDKAGATKAMLDAVKRGWSFKQFSESDPELDALQDYAPFKSALKAIQEPYWTLTSPISFNSRVAWGPNGLPEKLPASGNAYLLCSMLGVSSGAEAKINTDQEILNYLRRSAKADNTNPKGIFVFADHKDVRSRTREPNFAAAITALDKLGFESEIITSRLPKNDKPILGATIGSAKFNWKSVGKFQPGGIGDNLTSFGGRFDARNSQTTLAEFMRYGAAGASGTVVEPFAIQHKFPLPLIHAYYAQGFSLAESFYMSLAGPFQTLVVGDPLCQPFAKCVKIRVEGVNPNAEVTGKVAFKLQLDQSEAKVGAVVFYFDGKKIGNLKSGNFTLDTSQHPDGYHELRFVTVASDATQAQSRFVLPLIFDNTERKAEVSAETSGDTVEISANAPGADSIEIVCQGVTLKTLAGPEGKSSIPKHSLGSGEVSIQAIAKYGDRSVASVPQKVEIP